MRGKAGNCGSMRRSRSSEGERETNIDKVSFVTGSLSKTQSSGVSWHCQLTTRSSEEQTKTMNVNIDQPGFQHAAHRFRVESHTHYPRCIGAIPQHAGDWLAERCTAYLTSTRKRCAACWEPG